MEEKKLLRNILLIALSVICFHSASAQDNKYVFISFSMPKSLLKQIVRDCGNEGAVPVIRGFIDNNPRKTLLELQSIIEETGYGINIDPELFDKYAVVTVPTFVADKGDQYNKLHGNVSVEWAFNKLNEEIK